MKRRIVQARVTPKVFEIIQKYVEEKKLFESYSITQLVTEAILEKLEKEGALNENTR